MIDKAYRNDPRLCNFANIFGGCTERHKYKVKSFISKKEKIVQLNEKFLTG